MLPTEQELSNLLGIVYDAADRPSLWPTFMEKLARRTKSTSAALAVQLFDEGLYSLTNSWQVPEQTIRAYKEHYHALDAWAKVVVPRASEYPSGYVCTSESLCPLPQLKKTEFYNDQLAHGGIEHAMLALVENSQSCVASVCFYRDKSRAEFTESDLHILRFLVPHFRRVFKLQLHFSELRAHSAGVEAALDMLPTGVILLGPRGKIIRMNRSASALIAEKDGLLTTRSGLQAEQHVESAALMRMIQQAARTSNGKGLSAGGALLVSRRTRPPLQLFISPIHNSVIQTTRQIAAVVFINDPLRQQRPDQAVLRTLYGLTPAECRVALLLGEGHALGQIANTGGVTDNTVRSQIKSIFSKTGVRRQSDLVRLLLSNAQPTI